MMIACLQLANMCSDKLPMVLIRPVDPFHVPAAHTCRQADTHLCMWTGDNRVDYQQLHQREYSTDKTDIAFVFHSRCMSA